MELDNYSRHSATQLEWLEVEVTRHSNLVTALEFIRRLTGAPVIPNAVTQDEYTHDVTMRVRDDLYLAYGMT